jgi:hypothetical protein
MCAVVGTTTHDDYSLQSGQMHMGTVTKLVIANNDLWALTVNITKASILMQYLRIFSTSITRVSCYILLVALLPATLWATLGGPLLCDPVKKLWKPETLGHCLSAQVYWISVAGIDIGLDFLVLLLPLPAISTLHIARKQKLSILLLFLFGFFVCGVSVGRVASVLLAASQGQYTQSGYWAVTWSVVEANVGIICASLLALRPLVVMLFPRLRKKGRRSQPIE